MAPGLPPPDSRPEVSAAEAGPEGEGPVLYLGTNEGEGLVVDARAPAAAAKGLPWHDKKINTLALAPGAGAGGALLASAASDTTVKVRAAGAEAGAGGGERGGRRRCWRALRATVDC